VFANVVLDAVLSLSLIDFSTRNGHRNRMTPDLDSSQYEDSKNTKFVSVRQELKVMQRDLSVLGILPRINVAGAG
jgi:hypothetical protein